MPIYDQNPGVMTSHATIGEFVYVRFEMYVYAHMARGVFLFRLTQSPGGEALRSTPVTTRAGRVSRPVVNGRSNREEAEDMEWGD